MRISLLIFIVLSLFFLFSCSLMTQEEHSQETFEVLTHRSQERMPTQLSSLITDVSCSSQSDVLVFTLTNQGRTSWSVDRQADDTDEEFVNLRLFFNDYLVNANIIQRHPVSNEVLFGPQQYLSENCEPNRQILHPGSSISCTLEGLPLLEENTLRIETLGLDDRILFRCSQ